MYEVLQDALREALTRRLEPGLAADLSLALESLEAHIAERQAELVAPEMPPKASPDDDAVTAALAAAGIEPPALHLGSGRPSAPDLTSATPDLAQVQPTPPADSPPGRVVAGLRAKITEQGRIKVEGKDPAGKAVARTVQEILTAVTHREIGEISTEMLNLAVRVELLEKDNQELRQRIADLT